MATWSSQVGPVFAGAVAVALNGAVGALAWGAWSAVALTANANNRRAIFYVSLLQLTCAGRGVTALMAYGFTRVALDGVRAATPSPRRARHAGMRDNASWGFYRLSDVYAHT